MSRIWSFIIWLWTVIRNPYIGYAPAKATFATGTVTGVVLRAPYIRLVRVTVVSPSLEAHPQSVHRIRSCQSYIATGMVTGHLHHPKRLL